MGRVTRQREYVSKLVVEKQRAIYWVCALVERDNPVTRAAARQALAELGYDRWRIESLVLMGEPGVGAREPIRIAVAIQARS